MKQILITLLLACSAIISFAQPGSHKISGVFVRVQDSASYESAAATAHSQGYADIFYNEQSPTPHFKIWNGSSYTHVFDFNAGGGGTLTNGRGTTANGTAVDLGSATAMTSNASVTLGVGGVWGAANSSGTGIGLGSSAQILNAGPDMAIEMVNDGSVTIIDARATPIGLQYASDYSPTYLDRSLVDKEYVDDAVAGAGGAVSSVFTRTGAVTAQSGDYTAAQVTNTPAGTIAATTAQAAINELDTEKAALASPTFTGTPSLPTGAVGITQSVGTNNTTLSTTAFVQGSKYIIHNIQTGDYTPVLGDAFKGVLMRSVNPQTFTVPPVASVDYPEGTRMLVVPDSTGVITVAAGSGVLLESSSGVFTSCQNCPMVLEKKNSTNSWFLWNGAGGDFESGTYTPTITNTTNVTASTAYLCTYSRTDNTVTFSGQIDIDPTSASSSTILGMTIPVLSAFTTSRQCGGTFSAITSASDGGGIITDATNDRLTLQYICTTDVSNHTYSFHVTYQRIP